MKTILSLIFGALIGVSVNNYLIASQDKEKRTYELVTKIVDGDTIKLLDGRTVRLAWIDAPELDQIAGSAARHALESLIYQQYVSLVEIGKDTQGNTVAVVLKGGDLDINRLMLLGGYAWHGKQKDSQPEPDRELYEWAEKNAKKMRYGLWMNKKAEPPWQWRLAKHGENW